MTPAEIVKLALAEDLGPELDPTQDVTGQLLQDSTATGILKTNESGILAGRDVAELAFALVDKNISLNWHFDSGDAISPQNPICEISGNLKSISAAERVAINFLSHLSGIATLTSKFVKATNGQSQIYDTRKTTPGLRVLEKAAVAIGGGHNHRFSLTDAILIKDNHLTQLQIPDAVAQARQKYPDLFIEVECDTMEQVSQVMGTQADAILLDNMSPKEIAACVKMVSGAYITEASGGIQLKDISKIARTKVDRISVGALTKSSALDMGLDIHS